MRISIVLIIIILFQSCNSNNKDRFKNKVIELSSEIIALDSGEESLINPSQIVLLDSLLLIKNYSNSDFIFTLLDINQSKVLKHFGKFGGGPGEFSTDFILHKSSFPTSFEYYDFPARTYKRVILDSILLGNFAIQSIAKLGYLNKSSAYSSESVILQLQNFNDSIFLAKGLLGKGNRIGLASNDGQIIGEYFTYPDDNDHDPRFKIMAYNSIINVNPSKRRMVSAYIDSDWIEICQLNNKNELEIVYSDFSYLPDYYDKGKNQLELSKKNRLGNFYIDTTEKFIYVCKSDATIESVVRGRRVYGGNKEVDVYDWDGNAIKRLTLDFEVSAIAVDKNDKFLYALTFTPYPVLRKVNLPF